MVRVHLQRERFWVNPSGRNALLLWKQFSKLISSTVRHDYHLWLLINPVKRGQLVINDFSFLKPQSDLLFRVLDAVGAMADIAANVLSSGISMFVLEISQVPYNCVITTDGAWSRC